MNDARTRRAGQVAATLLYVGVGVVMALAAYWLMFAQFQTYDDEGYVALTLRHFVRGDELYGEINSQYGPAYYLLVGGAFDITGVSVSTNSGRLLQIVIWLAASLLSGFVAQRVTRSALLGVATTAITYRVLHTALAEPLHPVTLLAMLVAAAALALAVVTPWRPRLGLALLGVIGAVTALVKINVGGFLLIAAAFAVVICLPGRLSRPLIRVLASIFVVALPLALMLPDLDHEGYRNYALVVAAGAAALVLAASRIHPLAEAHADGWWAWLTGGALAAAVVVVLATLATGVGLADLVDGVIVGPSHQRDVFRIEAAIGDGALLWAVISLAAAAAVRFGVLDLDSRVGGALRLATGLALLLATTVTEPLALDGPGVLGRVGLLAWVAATAPVGREQFRLEPLVRVGLAMTAILQLLHAYPVAGAQMGSATALFPVLGAICVSDGLVVLLRDVRVHALRYAAPAACAALAAWAVITFVVNDARDARPPYRANTPLPFTGADRMRLPADAAAQYVQLVQTLQAHGCRVIVGQPTLGSITMWAGADVPVGLEPDGWTVQLDSEEQQRVLDRVRRGPLPCGLRNDGIAAGWQQGRPIARRPMVRYLERFVPAETVGDYQVLLPRSN